MPLDPFFTSKVKDPYHDERQRKQALAKALQFRNFAAPLPNKNKAAAIRAHCFDKAHSVAKGLHGSVHHKVTCGPSLTGFRSPKRIWTEHRDSQHPEPTQHDTNETKQQTIPRRLGKNLRKHKHETRTHT